MRAVKVNEMFSVWRVICAWQGEIEWCPAAQGVIDQYGKPDPSAESYAEIPTWWLKEWDKVERMLSPSRGTEEWVVGVAYGHYMARVLKVFQDAPAT